MGTNDSEEKQKVRQQTKNFPRGKVGNPGTYDNKTALQRVSQKNILLKYCAQETIEPDPHTRLKQKGKKNLIQKYEEKQTS